MIRARNVWHDVWNEQVYKYHDKKKTVCSVKVSNNIGYCFWHEEKSYKHVIGTYHGITLLNDKKTNKKTWYDDKRNWISTSLSLSLCIFIVVIYNDCWWFIKLRNEANTFTEKDKNKHTKIQQQQRCLMGIISVQCI